MCETVQQDSVYARIHLLKSVNSFKVCEKHGVVQYKIFARNSFKFKSYEI